MKIKLLRVLIPILLIIILGWVYIFLSKTNNLPIPQNNTNSTSFSFIVENSGSTNFPGWQVEIQNNGSAILKVNKLRLNNPSNQLSNYEYPAKTFDIKNIKNTISSIGDVSRVIPAQWCAKSVSFGSSTFIIYNGKQSGDLSCIFSTDQEKYYKLAQEVNIISAVVQSTINSNSSH